MEADKRHAEAEEHERRKSDLEFGRIANPLLSDYETTPKPKGGKRSASSVRLARTVVDCHLRPNLAGKAMPDIGRDDVELIIDAIPVPNQAMRRTVHVYAPVLWVWAIRRRFATEIPLFAIEKPAAPEARDRTLKDAELLSVWSAAADLASPFDAFIRLLILTGQRRGEVAGIMWGELDRENATWIIPKGKAKNDCAHIVPLAPAVVAEFDRLALKSLGGKWPSDGPVWPASGYVLTTTGKAPISGLSKAKRALDDAIAKARTETKSESIEAWRLHDIRRTMATGLQKLGVRFEVTEAVLNHVS